MVKFLGFSPRKQTSKSISMLYMGFLGDKISMLNLILAISCQ